MAAHALIDTLVAPTDQDHLALLRPLLCHPLCEGAPLRREEDDGRGLAQPARSPERFHRLEQRLRLHHHPATAAKRVVIYGPMAIVGVLADVVDFDLDEPLILGPLYNAVGEGTGERTGEKRQDVKAHPRAYLVRWGPLHPRIISSACGIAGTTTPRHSRTPAGLPGRLMMSVPDLTPATDRLSIAIGVFASV